ncbi:MAG: TAXI family TRAP transporter solute-binding subunit [Alphaproteobacteria bacterium]|nr:TAXI family TRAP transporter solute-binding subunit [Alphaproteobacteria bacterium]MDA7983425.1 TAXI family TRAP transporter solute-binding subunit [Alphaproteobacteria bacterium]MDA8009451.1 TAXI family TRAP transporter solute-binding subunit [Alphaproteobacteria bacterium]
MYSKYIIAAAATLAVAGIPTAKAQEFFTIGTGGPTGVYFQVGNAICQMIHREAAEGRDSGRHHGFRCSAPSTAGSVYNINNIAEGELQFGVAQSDWQYHAVNGTSRFEDNQIDELRAVFSVHPEPFQILVGRDSDINGWNDLQGKRVNIGNPGSGQRGTFEVLLDANGVDAGFFSAATELTSSEQSSALCNGDIHAYGYTVGVPNAGVAQAADGCGARIINLDNSAVQKLVSDNPFYAFATIPSGTYSTVTRDVTTFGVKATFVTSEDVDDDLVYEVTRAVFENFDAFKSLHPAFANLTPEAMISEGISAPIHEGAMRYYREKGWQ